MAKKIEIPKNTSREFSPEEIQEIITGLFEFMNDHEQKGNIFVNDYLILQKQILHSDIKILRETNSEFNQAFCNGMQIEETKLKKFAAADRLNASFVKEILNRDHNSSNY